MNKNTVEVESSAKEFTDIEKLSSKNSIPYCGPEENQKYNNIKQKG